MIVDVKERTTGTAVGSEIDLEEQETRMERKEKKVADRREGSAAFCLSSLRSTSTGPDRQPGLSSPGSGVDDAIRDWGSEEATAVDGAMGTAA